MDPDAMVPLRNNLCAICINKLSKKYIDFNIDLTFLLQNQQQAKNGKLLVPFWLWDQLWFTHFMAFSLKNMNVIS